MTLLATWVLALTALAGCATEDGDDSATRVLLFGDSITQGRPGDWTWRYRLWQQLRDTGRPVDFVGPAENLVGDSLDYADPTSTETTRRCGVPR